MKLATTALFASGAAAQAARSNFSSPDFVVHARPAGACDFSEDLGYLHPTYIWSTPYAATLEPARSDAITGYFTFLPDARSSSLVFPDPANPPLFYGFYVNQAVTESLVSLPYGTYGGQGAFADAQHKVQVLSEAAGVPISWFACENYPLDDGPHTAVFLRRANGTTPAGCVDVDLIVEYLDDSYNYPVPCST